MFHDDQSFRLKPLRARERIEKPVRQPFSVRRIGENDVSREALVLPKFRVERVTLNQGGKASEGEPVQIGAQQMKDAGVRLHERGVSRTAA